MGIYSRYVLPRLIDLAMQTSAVKVERGRLVPLARGTVLEVGIGSGLNIPFYSADVERLYGLDPSRELWKIARNRAARAPFPIEFFAGPGERLPLGDESVDTVVSTWTMCTIPEPAAALKEMRRVLKPDGRLIFIEHGLAPDARVVVWQNRLTPLWRRIGGGCHLNRKIDELIRGAGFSVVRIQAGYIEGPKPFAYLFRGVARPD